MRKKIALCSRCVTKENPTGHVWSRKTPAKGSGHTLVIACLLLALSLTPFLPARGAELPIPELARWEADMLTYGQENCARLADPSVPFSEKLNEHSGHVYYDAERVFYQIADYTGDTAKWNSCAQVAEGIYRDQYVIPNNGSVFGYWNFTTGLRMDYERTGDAQSKDAVILLSQNASTARETSLDWSQSADRSREVAYAILSYINAEALGEPKRRRRIDLVNQAYDHMDQWFVRFAWPGPWQQSPQETSRLAPFMVGLTAHTLIRDWEETQDPRLLPALRLAADWLWANAWMPSEEGFWQDSTDLTNVARGGTLLIAPLYAFLYWQTGETKYRDQGDAVFAGGVKYAWLGAGKQFNQQYWWSFDYVRWRSSPSDTSDTAPPVTDTTPPIISSVAASSITSTSATITWVTNEASDSLVEYGKTKSYGQKTPVNTSLVTSHSVTLNGLSNRTVYHYRVISMDAAGNLAVSSDQTFRTTK